MSRGIAMYESLQRHCQEFHLYIVAFDDHCDQLLRKMKLTNVTVVSLKTFEDPELLKVKPTRTGAEYCWTCTSSVILFCIKKFSLPSCTYLDADLFFYKSPEILIREKPPEYHVIITSHRYTKYYDQSTASGTYCVQFMYFDNSAESMEVLTGWRNQCLEWCYNRIEDGKFGDQKYLDDWKSKYNYVWELQHLGGGLAPWNIQQYHFKNSESGIEIKTGNSFDIVFYHFHGVRFYQNEKIILAPNTYYLSKLIRLNFYYPYLGQLQKAKKMISQFDAGLDSHGSRPASFYFKDKYLKGMLSYLYCNFIKRFFNWDGQSN